MADQPAAPPSSSSPGLPFQGAASLQFLGTATMLIHFGELTILTDPNFLHQGERAYLGYGLSARRLTEPALGVDELPELSGVLLSHLHGDHWDRRARRGLDHALPIVTTTHAARRLRRHGFAAATGLTTWQRQDLASGPDTLQVTAMPGQHAPGPLKRVLPPVMGSHLEFRQGSAQLRLYISGDTLFVEALRQIPSRVSAIDAAVFHLGGTMLPGGVMVTMDGKQGADLLEFLDPPVTIPVHYDDYSLFKSPLRDFTDEVDRRGLTDRVRVVERGQTIDLTPFLQPS